MPAVLDDAVEALHHTSHESSGNNFQGLEVEAPSASGGGGINMARQSSASLASISHHPRMVSPSASAQVLASPGVGSGVLLNSRSPSPTSVHSGTSSLASPVQSPLILGRLATGQVAATALGGIDNVSPTSGRSGESGNWGKTVLGGKANTGAQLPGAWAGTPNEGEENDPKAVKPEDVSEETKDAHPICIADLFLSSLRQLPQRPPQPRLVLLQ